jgi:hypothetical protein
MSLEIRLDVAEPLLTGQLDQNVPDIVSHLFKDSFSVAPGKGNSSRPALQHSRFLSALEPLQSLPLFGDINEITNIKIFQFLLADLFVANRIGNFEIVSVKFNSHKVLIRFVYFLDQLFELILGCMHGLFDLLFLLTISEQGGLELLLLILLIHFRKRRTRESIPPQSQHPPLPYNSAYHPLLSYK